jgi:glycosyltransferase involved in cell wall biosynthesis
MTFMPEVLLLGEATFSDRPGGLNRYVEDLHGALGAAGHRPSAALVLGPGVDAPAGFTTTSDLTKPIVLRLLAYRSAAARLVRSSTVIDAHFSLYAALPVFTSRMRRHPLVVHFHGPWADESVLSRGMHWTTPLKRFLERAVYRRADRVVVLSGSFRELLIKRYGVEPDRVVLIPPGVDLKRFVPGDRAAARARLAIPEDAFVVVATRRLDPRMGLDALLDAWATVQATLPNSILAIAGDGPERKRLADLCSRLPNPDGVRLLGRVTDDDLVALYQGADCSVVPTRALEGFGLVALESFASGTPAIVTRVGGLPEAVEGLDPSLIVEPDDPDRLAERLEAAARGALPGRGSCRRHAERYAWGDVAARHLDVFREVAGPPGPRPRVVFLDHCARLSGGELALVRLLTALQVDAHVILAEDGPLVERLEAIGATVEILLMDESARGLGRDRVRPSRLPVRSAIASVGYTFRVARRLRRLRPDLVHTNSLKAALYGGGAGRLAGIPVVWHIRDRITNDYLPNFAARAVRTLASVLPRAVVTDTSGTLDALGALRAPHAVIPSPLGIRPSSESRAARMSEGPLTIGMVGRLAPWKGQHIFLDAFAAAFADGAERAVIVGDALFAADEAEYAAGLRARAERLGIAARVTFTGHVDDPDSWYERFDVLVHASTTPEPFGQVIVEGLSHGLAVVATSAGGPAEIITPGRDGLLVPSGDADALADCLRLLASDLELRRRLGEAGRARSLAFGSDAAARRMLELYQRAMAPRSRAKSPRPQKKGLRE